MGGDSAPAIGSQQLVDLCRLQLTVLDNESATGVHEPPRRERDCTHEVEAVGTVLKAGRTLTVCRLEVHAVHDDTRTLVRGSVRHVDEQ